MSLINKAAWLQQPTIDEWSASIEQELRTFLRNLYPQGAIVDVSVKKTPTGYHILLQGITAKNANGERATIKVERDISVLNEKVTHSFFTISKDLQGQGVSPYIQRKFLELYDQMGMREIATHANLDVGGYTWARYGFRPSFSDPRNATLLGKWRRTLSPWSEEVGEAGFNSWWDGLLAGPREEAKRVLLGSDWYGSVSLDDPASRAAYEGYIQAVGSRSDLYQAVYGPTQAPAAAGEVLDPASRIDALLTKAEPRLARIFRASIAELKSSLDLNEVADLLSTGQVDVLLERLQVAAERLGQESTAIFITAGQGTTQFLASADVASVLFNVVNERAVAAAQANQLRLVRAFSNDQRAAVNAAIVDGVQRGANPVEQARAFRDVVGLTERQSLAVANYRRLLGHQEDGVTVPDPEALSRALRDGRFDRTVNAAIRRDQPLTAAQVDRMVERYAERYVKYRAEVIGRTEALRAVHQGAEEGYAQAVERGSLLQEQIIREWASAHDGRVRESHRHLDGVQRPWGGTFPGLAGDLRYPGDPDAPAAETVQCRCILTTRIRSRKALSADGS